MKHCTQCKTGLPDGARFCTSCGAAQEAVPDTSACAERDGAVGQEEGVSAGARGVAIGGSVRSSIIITSDGSVVRKQARPPLPAKCPYCGVSIRPNKVEWLDDTAVVCAYCGSTLMNWDSSEGEDT